MGGHKRNTAFSFREMRNKAFPIKSIGMEKWLKSTREINKKIWGLQGCERSKQEHLEFRGGERCEQDNMELEGVRAKRARHFRV